jgi:chemotaxis methyl-accepting protein methylase
MDISADSVARAEAGRYMPQGVELTRPLDVDTLASLFDRDGDELVVKSALQQNIRWLVGDAVDPGLAGSLGLQDVVLANNFLIHMNDREAASCMANVARLLRPGGLFVCRGVALPVRETVVQQLGFKPLSCHWDFLFQAQVEVKDFQSR